MKRTILPLTATISNIAKLLQDCGYDVTADGHHILQQGQPIGDIQFVRAGGPSDTGGYEGHVMVHPPGTYLPTEGGGWVLRPELMKMVASGRSPGTTPSVRIVAGQYNAAVELIASHLEARKKEQ